MSDADYLADVRAEIMAWPLPDTAVAVRKLRDRAIGHIVENPDTSVVEAFVPGMFVTLAHFEARLAALGANSTESTKER